ncbi:MAG: hypothetical protein PHP69_04805 [Candidatus Omnitrophica bacterium]|nr:hypothetical protein [Candidatus Omnitrophota bacterium]MDD5080401.1 hypothetical protein [Candidatus Omnitrophota bacterium]MDD5440713.1 hypothetical protein [Candidatus Omnitrophota bacterium]
MLNRRMDDDNFFTVINCIDGRVQLPVIEYIKSEFNVEYVDVITEPGPNMVLAERTDIVTVGSILRKVDLSLERNKSLGVAVSGHFDCKANPVEEKTHKEQIEKACDFLNDQYENMKTVGLWVSRLWVVEKIC